MKKNCAKHEMTALEFPDPFPPLKKNHIFNFDFFVFFSPVPPKDHLFIGARCCGGLYARLLCYTTSSVQRGASRQNVLGQRPTSGQLNDSIELGNAESLSGKRETHAWICFIHILYSRFSFEGVGFHALWHRLGLHFCTATD